MAKKNILDAEIFLIQLEATDVLTASGDTPNTGFNPGDTSEGMEAPSRFNYRGMEMGYEDEEW